MTTVTFRTDENLKAEATKIFESLGINFSLAINMFLRQTVIQKRFPCTLESDLVTDAAKTYPPEFFLAFGKGMTIEVEEPEDFPFEEEKCDL